MKKVLSIILTLMMIMSMAVIPAQADGNTILAEGWSFIDIASHGDTYVALAKDANRDYARMYYSADGGISWTASSNQPLVSNTATIYSNKSSQQQLVWWEEKGIFVVHGSGKTFTSPDGASWTENANLHWSSNAMMTASGENLLFGGADSVNGTNTTTDKLFSNNKYSLGTEKYFATAVSAAPQNAGGITQVLAVDTWQYFMVDLSVSGQTYTWSNLRSNSGATFSASPFDAVYAAGAARHLVIDGSEALVAMAHPGDTVKLKVKEGTGITAVAANDSYIICGLADGTLYWTLNTTLSSDTDWYEIPVLPGKTAASEPIKAIDATDSDNIVILSNTQIYTGTVSGYANTNEYTKLGDISISGASPFEGVKLIGGTYSPSLGKYIVYGNTVEIGEQNKYWGKIYISSDLENWNCVYTGYTFSNVRNGAVWWEDQGIFIVSASTTENYGITLTSSDGLVWTVTTNADTDFRHNTDLVISNGKVYATNNGKVVRYYTEWNKAHMTNTVLGSIIPDAWYMNGIAVSDEADPAICMIQNGNVAVRNNESTAETEIEKWTTKGSVAGSGAITDAVFSSKLNKFIAVSNTGFRTSLIAKNGDYEQGPVVTGGVVCNAIDLNDDIVIMAAQNGNLYAAPHDTNFKLNVATMAKVNAAASVESENTMNVTNVFLAGDKFIATSSDNVTSDVLVVAKNNGGNYVYTKVSEASQVTGLTAGETLTLKIDGVNMTDSAYPFGFIAAVYSADGRLLELSAEDKALPASFSGNLSIELEVPDSVAQGSYMKIFVWDSITGMTPLRSAVSPF